MSSADTRCSVEPHGCEHASAHRYEPAVVSADNVIPKPGDLSQHNTHLNYSQSCIPFH